MKSSRASFWMATLFCFSCFLLFGWYGIYMGHPSRQVASTAEKNAIDKINQAQRNLQNLDKSPLMSCTCKIGDEENVLRFENPENCGEDRNYLEDSLKTLAKLDKQGYYTKTREDSVHSEELPRKCTLFIMRRFWKDRARTAVERRDADIEFNRTAPPDKLREIKDIDKYKPDPHLYAKCDPQGNGTPERYGHKACVTEPYVNLVHNALLDVSSCLGVPAKFIAPKLSNESGLHVNAFGLVNDGGIGQFTDQALADVAQNYDEFKDRILNSTKASCRRLRSIPGAVPKEKNEILSTDEQRCHAISVPPNPLRSLVYYGIFYQSTKRNSAKAYARRTDPKDPNFLSIEKLLNKAGVADIDQEKLKQMMFVMSYNSGPVPPSSALREWLKYRIDQKKLCSKKKPCPVTAADFNMNYWPTKEQMSAPRGEGRAQVILDTKENLPLSLAEYLFAWKDSLYIAAVRAQARVLDKSLGEGTCTESKFLEL